MSAGREDLCAIRDEWKVLLEQAHHPLIRKHIGDQVETYDLQIERTSAGPSLQKTIRAPEASGNFTALSSFSWDQTDDFVKVYLSVGNVTGLKKGNIGAQFETESLDVTITNLGDGRPNLRFHISQLSHPIKPTACSYKLRDGIISLKLCKLDRTRWSELAFKATQANPPPKIEPQESEDPSDSIMKIMKRIYTEGDDEMKQSIAKAWTEAQNKRSEPALDDFY